MKFFWPIGKISGELYIGKGAGKRLLSCIENSKSCIKVFSPFTSANFLELIFSKADQGIQVECVTQIISDTESPYSETDKFGLGRVYQQFIKQHTRMNPEKKEEKEYYSGRAKTYKSLSFLFGILLFILLTGGVSLSFLGDSHPVLKHNQYFLFGMISLSCFILLYLSQKFSRKAKHTKNIAESIKISNHSYTLTKNFYIIPKNTPPHIFPFPHLKLIIIDNRVAFLGSLNFTNSGLNNNLESCIRIDDLATIQQLTDCYTELYEHAKQHSFSVQYLGKYYFEQE